jgi:hypothetical protein
MRVALGGAKIDVPEELLHHVQSGCQPSLGPWLAGVCILSKAMTASPMTNADTDDMLSKIGIATITKLPW